MKSPVAGRNIPKSIRKNRRRRKSAIPWIVGMVVLFAAFLIYYQNWLWDVFEILYGPTAGVILILMVIQYLVLKSGDRTRIYRLEIERLSRIRRNQEDLLRSTRTVLEPIVEGNTETVEEDERWNQQVQEIYKELKDRF